MKNLKFLSFVLLFSILVIAGCEKANVEEQLSCDGEDLCPVDENLGISSIEVESAPTVVVESNDEGDLNGNGEGFRDEEIIFENNEQTVEEPVDNPMMRIMVDEESNPDEIEITPSQTCEALGGTWNEGDCTLSDGSKVYF